MGLLTPGLHEAPSPAAQMSLLVPPLRSSFFPITGRHSLPFPLILPPSFILLIGNYLFLILQGSRTARLTSLLSTVKARDFMAISPRLG